MLKLYLAAMLMCLTTVWCREANKFTKTVPTITNSLVNLGKMEISFFFDGKRPDDPTKSNSLSFPNIPIPITRSHAIEPCPCSAFKSPKDFLSSPSDLINKILRSNDLFKDPTSAHCCDSHEQIQENTIYFELNPPNNAPMTINNLKNPMRSPSPLEKLMKSGPMQAMRPKAMEIFLFPKRKDIASLDFSTLKKPVAKDGIQVVGDKEVKPLNEGASVKKDLTSILEKKEFADESKVESVTNTNAL